MADERRKCSDEIWWRKKKKQMRKVMSRTDADFAKRKRRED
jgi:hypothetical protein